MTTKPESFPAGADVGAVALDLGSFFVRAGNAGEDNPKFFAHSLVGRSLADIDMEQSKGPSQPRLKFPLSFSSLQKDLSVEPCLFQPSHQLAPSTFPSLESILNPVEPLQINKEAFETICHEIFNLKKGFCDGLSGRPIIMSEPSLHNKSLREACAEILFETFETEAVYSAKSAVLTCFAVGRTGGVVVDIGSTSTTITPVQDGYTLQKPILELPIGGSLMDYQLGCLLKSLQLESKIVPIFSVRKKIRTNATFAPVVESVTEIPLEGCDPSFLRYSEKEVLRWMREAICRVSEVPLPVQQNQQQQQQIKHTIIGHHSQSRYELPDGTAVDSEDLAHKIPECLFNFDLILGRGSPNSSPDPLPRSLMGFTGLTGAVGHCVQSCDVDIRKDLLGALIISGGCSLMPGLADRVTRQFQEPDSQILPGTRYKVLCPVSSQERRFLPWIGASILASLASFQQMWMSRQEYLEHGVTLLGRRCIQ